MTLSVRLVSYPAAGNYKIDKKKKKKAGDIDRCRCGIACVRWTGCRTFVADLGAAGAL